MNHAILERKLVLSWHMKGRILHTAYAVYIVQKDLPPPSKQLAAPASLLPSFPAARSARMRRSKFIGNGHYCSWFWFDSKKKPNNRKHFERLFCAPVVHMMKLRWFPLTSDPSTCLSCTTGVAGLDKNPGSWKPMLSLLYWQNGNGKCYWMTGWLRVETGAHQPNCQGHLAPMTKFWIAWRHSIRT